MQAKSVSSAYAALLAAAVLSPHTPASAGTHTMPTPGLYQIHTLTDQKYDGLQLKTTPSANGAVAVVDIKVKDGAERRVYKGKAAEPLCIAPNTRNPGFKPPAGSCTGAPAVTGPNGIAFSLACGTVDMNTVVRQLDAKTWEYNVTTVEYEGAAGMAGMPDFATQKKMFEVTAKHGATPEERADAVKTLANWPAYEAETRASMAEMAKEEGAAGNRPAARKVLRKTTAVSRWTKIAPTCTAVASAAPAAR
jgi:hypothetical protein